MSPLGESGDAGPQRATPRGRLFRKYLASFVVVVATALMVYGAVDAWFSYREQKSLLIDIQREQADAAAAKIGQFIGEIERQLGWLTQMPAGTIPREELRVDAIRLLRLTPAVAEVTVLDAHGREQLRVSRMTLDAVGSQADRSAWPAFRAAKAKRVYYGPVYFHNETEPFVTLAVAGAGTDADVVVAEVNLRFVWELVTQVKVGQSGFAFVVDPQGRLIAHPQLWLVLQNVDLSRLPHVKAALAAGTAAARGDVAADLAQRAVLSVSAPVAALGWRVFVELPIDEAYASLYGSMIRTAAVLVALLAFAVLVAWLLSRRMTVPIQALTVGAARIGGGDLAQRITIKTGDELEALGAQFNRMAVQLHDSYATLEGKVNERTAELAQARDQAWAEHAEAKHAREAAEHANETKSRFLAVVSHELRTPLNGVLGVLQLLDGGRLDADQARYLQTAAASGGTLLTLIDAILEYARLEAGTETVEPRDFQLDQLVEAAVELMRPQAQAKGLALDLVLHASVAARVSGDPARLNRVLLNLLSNALKFTEQGRIDVSAKLERRDAAGMRLWLAVTDTGIGVAPEMQERIFEDFVQADDTIARRFGGTGLGLAISRRLARLMGGELTVESALGVGSTFRLALPLAHAGDAAPTAERGFSTRSLEVLLVDDDPVNREIGAALLRKLGHSPAPAASGPAAVALAQAQAFDVVLMDLHMPGMDGIEAASQIHARAAEPKPRIIALTADMSEHSRERLAVSKIGGRVGKPIVLDALRRALAGEGDGWRSPIATSAQAMADSLIDDGYFADQEILLGTSRLRGLRTLFADESATLLHTMAAAAAANDAVAVGRAAHRLGSAASALALTRLFASCAEIETQAASRSPDALAALIAPLSELRDRSLAALDERLRERIPA